MPFRLAHSLTVTGQQKRRNRRRRTAEKFLTCSEAGAVSATRLSHPLFSYASTYFEHLIKHSHSVTVSLTLCLTQSAISLSCYTLMPSIYLSIVLTLSLYSTLTQLNSHSTDSLSLSLYLRTISHHNSLSV